MARTNTLPQAAKPRHDDLDTFERRDGSVSNRNAVYRGKKNPYWIPFATRVYRDAGWDTVNADAPGVTTDGIDEGRDYDPFDEENWYNYSTDEEGWDLFDEEEIDPDEFVDHGGYGTYRGAHVLGQGFGLDAIFGEGYLGGNCGFSVRDRP